MDRHETLDWIDRLPPSPGELAGHDIVMLGHQRWNTHFTPVHGTALRLAQKNRVVFVEPPDSMAQLRHHASARNSLRRVFNRLDVINDSFAIYHTPPLFLPMQARSRLIRATLDGGYEWAIRDAMRGMNMTDAIFWVFQFNAAGAIEAIRPRCTVYECAEEAAEFADDDQIAHYVNEQDARLCATADVVIVPNQYMHDLRCSVSRSIHVHPWAVDVEHYGRAMDPDLPIPPDIAILARPVVGLYGNIDGCRFDVELYTELCRRHPEWSFAAIGRLWPNFDPGPLKGLANVHLMGPKPMSELPAYCKAFDVCIIPYAINGFTRSITPLKLTEYLATGKPVVTTALPAAAVYGDTIRVAKDVDEFEAHVIAALAEPPELRATRVETAKRYNWDRYMERKTAAVAAAMK